MFDRQLLEDGIPVILLASVLVLASGAMTSFPGGTLELPTGCKAPAKIPWRVDMFMGFIDCDGNATRIMVSGGLVASRLCSGDRLSIQTHSGVALGICAGERRVRKPPKVIREMIIDLGAGSLVAEIKTPRDALLLLQVANSFRPASQQ